MLYIILGFMLFFWLFRGGPVGFPFILLIGVLALMMSRRGSYWRRPPGYGSRHYRGYQGPGNPGQCQSWQWNPPSQPKPDYDPNYRPNNNPTYGNPANPGNSGGGKSETVRTGPNGGGETVRVDRPGSAPSDSGEPTRRLQLPPGQDGYDGASQSNETGRLWRGD